MIKEIEEDPKALLLAGGWSSHQCGNRSFIVEDDTVRAALTTTSINRSIDQPKA